MRSPRFFSMPRMTPPLLSAAILVLFSILLLSVRVRADQDDQPDSQHLPIIKLGMSTALTGPASFLGINMRSGVLAAIQELNHQGGISGARVELICLDDGYEPTRTAPNMRRLISRENALAIIGNVGTPTAVTAIPIANSSKIAFYGAFTGAGILRKNPPDRYVINYRASYAEEVSEMIEALISIAGLKPRQIAFFTQRDTYGDAGYTGGIEALRRHGLKDENRIIHSRYERNTLAVENGLADIILAEPPQSHYHGRHLCSLCGIHPPGKGPRVESIFSERIVCGRRTAGGRFGR